MSIAASAEYLGAWFRNWL